MKTMTGGGLRQGLRIQLTGDLWTSKWSWEAVWLEICIRIGSHMRIRIKVTSSKQERTWFILCYKHFFCSRILVNSSICLCIALQWFVYLCYVENCGWNCPMLFTDNHRLPLMMAPVMPSQIHTDRNSQSCLCPRLIWPYDEVQVCKLFLQIMFFKNYNKYIGVLRKQILFKYC